MKNFEGLGLSDALNASLLRMDYTEPTPVQAQAIPLAMQGRDVLGSAQTGTGKTAAFSIPLVEGLLRSEYGSALVLTPTRELAKQVLDVIHQILGRDSGINTAFIIGGEPMHKQLKQLNAQPRIVVGTPGRINDHLRRGTLKLNETNFLVLDETDRMLDMGFGVQLDAIVEFLPRERQTLMFSATLPDGIIKLSSKYLNNPARVSVGATNVVAQNIEQEVIRIEQPKKYEELKAQLLSREGSVIVFIKTKHNADKVAKKLRVDGFTSEALHGDLRQGKRDKVMRNFHQKNFRTLVATDIAARGLDVPHIEHVINYDIPQVAEDYIHRMGRTARAGSKGAAVTFVAGQDVGKWRDIERLLDPDSVPDNHAEQPQGRNKSRRTPYRGRPVSAKKREDSKWVKSRFDKGDDKREDKPKAKNTNSKNDRYKGDVPRDGKPKSHKFKSDKRRDDKPDGMKFVKKPFKKSGGSKSGSKSDGSAPMKKRVRNR